MVIEKAFQQLLNTPQWKEAARRTDGGKYRGWKKLYADGNISETIMITALREFGYEVKITVKKPKI